MVMNSDELLLTLITSGLVLMFVWWLFKSGAFWSIFWGLVILGAIIFILNVFN